MKSGNYNFQTQKLGLHSIANLRELGGYVLPDGRKVRRGVLFRGATLNSASDEDLVALREKFNLSIDFDFRTKVEVEHKPDRVPEGVKYVWLPTIDPDTEEDAGTPFPKEAYLDLGNWLVKNAENPMVQNIARHMYTDMIQNEYTQVQYAGFMQMLLKNEGGAVYWHCSQGKDRTGLGTAFVLAALGADRSLILEDYAISEEVYKDELAAYASKVSSDEAFQVLRTFISVNVDYFNNALDFIDRRYGSLMSYLQGPLLLMDEDIETLRKKYTE